VPKQKVDVSRVTERGDAVSARAGDRARPPQDLVAMAATIGVIAAGVALFEVALIPGLVIGGAAVLAPRYLPRKYLPKKYLPKKYLPAKVLPKLRRRLQPLLNPTVRRPIEPAVSRPDRPDARAPQAVFAGLAIKQALAKTITFRIIVTTLDFTTNYVVLGELATAAGLSGVTLVVGPLFYLVHETAWNHFSASVERKVGPWGTAVELPALLPVRPDAATLPAGPGGFTINRALAKTITFRTIATAIDFTTNYLVVGELATAVGLSAFAFVVGPFVYLGHEMAWDHYGSPRERTVDLPTTTSLVPG
jgi:uncharacterized membrane protein